MTEVVDAHGHYVPRGLFDAVRDAGGVLPSLDVVRLSSGRDALAMPGLDELRPMPEILDSATTSLSWLDQQRIDLQVVGTWADLFGYQLDAGEGSRWCRLLNDLQWEELHGEPRLVPLAVLPLQDPAAALREIEASHATGYRAVTIGCRAGHLELDDPSLEPVWAELAARGMAVVMHPSFHATERRTSDLGLPNTVGRPHDTDVAVARLVLSGVLARNPATRLLLMHGGGSIPLLWGRLERNHAITSGTTDPERSRGCLWFDSVVYRPEALERLVSFAGPDRVLLGSDYPFPIRDPAPRRVVDLSSLASDVKDRILGANAAAFFALTRKVPTVPDGTQPHPTHPRREVITTADRRIEVDHGPSFALPQVVSGAEHLSVFSVHDERIRPDNQAKADGAPLRVLDSVAAKLDVSKRSVEDMGFWHRSTDYSEIIICIRGALLWETELGSNVLRAGDILVIPRGVAHRSALCEDSAAQNVLVEVKVKDDLTYVGPRP
jgi:aminocarboxymuconate-semialdehyde decarboxylase